MNNSLVNEISIRAHYSGAVYGIMCVKDGNTVYAYNEDNLIYCASCIKCFIAMAVYYKIAHNELNQEDMIEVCRSDITSGAGVLQYLPVGAKLRIGDYLSLMLIFSDNTAANVLLRIIGISYVNEISRNKGFTRTCLYNGFYPRNYSYLAVTTAREYCMLFERLSKGQLVNKELDQEMLNLLASQKYKQILEQALVAERLDHEYRLCSKSGKINGNLMNCKYSIVCDGGIFYVGEKSYCVSILAQLPGSASSEELRSCVENSAQISKLLYKVLDL